MVTAFSQTSYVEGAVDAGANLLANAASGTIGGAGTINGPVGVADKSLPGGIVSPRPSGPDQSKPRVKDTAAAAQVFPGLELHFQQGSCMLKNYGIIMHILIMSTGG